MAKVADVIAAMRAALRQRKDIYAHLRTPGNVKALAYELARLRSLEMRHRSETEARPSPAPLTSLTCAAADWDSAWLPYWLDRLGYQPAFHRKLWEFAYIAQALSEHGSLRPGSRGLGFGCGKEPLASLFVALGCDVTATDLQAADARAKHWGSDGQHAASIESVWVPSLCSREDAAERLHFRALDMNEVPAELHDGFDFCWSSCALEHLGSIELGLKFILASARCLRPGGVGVHTTELNPAPGETLDHQPTVLFQTPHFEDLRHRLAAQGVTMSPLVQRAGDSFLDGYVDVPPYPDPDRVGSTLTVLHLKLLIASFQTTSVGIVFRKTGSVAA